MIRNKKKNQGFTLVEIMIVVLIIGILMAIAVPNFIKARETSRKNSCIANLKQIDSAKEQWAMDNQKATGAVVAWTDLTGATGYLKGPATGPVCPAGGTYTIGNVGTNPSCSKSADGHVLP
jgi:prepilin-type N-terminal cleavage/methylation domain-containing protein